MNSWIWRQDYLLTSLLTWWYQTPTDVGCSRRMGSTNVQASAR